MKKRSTAGSLLVLAIAVAGYFLQSRGLPPPASPAPSSAQPVNARSPGFRSRSALEEHFAKHGAEFGQISMDQYLAMAQALRDAPAQGAVIERIRDDGVVTRFDRKTGAFGAYNPDRTIRTFFRPDDGEAYFRRQAEREQSPQ